MESPIIDMFSVLIIQNHKSMQKLFSDALEGFGLKVSSLSCMYIIRCNKGGCSATVLRETTCYDKALISRLLGEMQKLGYICRNPEDNEMQRGYRYILTEKGERTTELITRASAEISAEITKDIPPAELDAFYRTGAKLTDNLRRLANSKKDHRIQGGLDKECLN